MQNIRNNKININNSMIYKNKLIIFLFGLFSFLIPFDNIILIDEKVGTLTKIILIILTLFVFIELLSRNKGKNNPESSKGFPFYPWLIFAFYALMSIFWSVDLRSSVRGLVTLIGLILCFSILSIRIWNYQEVILLKRAIVLGGVIASLLSIYLSIKGIHYLDSGRSSLIISERTADPNLFAASLILPLSFLLNDYINLSNRDKKRLINIVLLFLILLAILLSGSRGAAIGAIVSIIYISLSKKGILKIIVVSLIMAIIVAIFLPDYHREIFLNRFSLANIQTTKFAGRIPLWETAILAFLERPLVGWGYNSFPSLTSGNFAEAAIIGAKYGQVAHNIALQILCELGSLGFILFVFGTYKTISYSLINSKFSVSHKAISGSLLGIMITSLSLGTLNYKFFWLILFLSSTKISNIFLHHNKGSVLRKKFI